VVGTLRQRSASFLLLVRGSSMKGGAKNREFSAWGQFPLHNNLARLRGGGSCLLDDDKQRQPLGMRARGAPARDGREGAPVGNLNPKEKDR